MAKKRPQPTDAVMKEKALSRWENEGGSILSPKRGVDKKGGVQNGPAGKKGGPPSGAKRPPKV